MPSAAVRSHAALIVSPCDSASQAIAPAAVSATIVQATTETALVMSGALRAKSSDDKMPDGQRRVNISCIMSDAQNPRSVRRLTGAD